DNRNNATIAPMPDLSTTLKPLRDSTEEPCAGRSEAEMDRFKRPRRGGRSESIPHAGICKGTAR
ncbi:hypothetical protein QEH52_19625, partial [Coraliomargarita sp. SDUM461003]